LGSARIWFFFVKEPKKQADFNAPTALDNAVNKKARKAELSTKIFKFGTCSSFEDNGNARWCTAIKSAQAID